MVPWGAVGVQLDGLGWRGLSVKVGRGGGEAVAGEGVVLGLAGFGGVL